MMLWEDLIRLLKSEAPSHHAAVQACLDAISKWRDSNGKAEVATTPHLEGESLTRLQRLEDLLQALATGESQWPDAEAKWNKLLALLPAVKTPEQDETVRGETAQGEDTSKPATTKPLAAQRRERKRSKTQARHKAVAATVSSGSASQGQPKQLDYTLLVLFLESHFGEIDRLDGLALEYEKGNAAAFDEIRRKVHTFKGELGLLGLVEETEFLHRIEDAFEKKQIETDDLLHAIKRLHRIWQDLVTASTRSGLYVGETVGKSKVETIPSGAVISKTSISVETAKPAPPKSSPKLAIGRFTAPMREDESSFLNDFKTEAAEHFQSLSGHILEIENDPHNEEAINGVFRVYHSIKGVAGFLNLKPVQTLSHALENLVAKARSHLLVLGPPEITLLLAAGDCLKDMVSQASYADGQVAVEVDAKAQKYLETLHALEAGESLAKDLPASDIAQTAQAKPIQENPKSSELALAESAGTNTPERETKASAATEDSLRVSAKKLDQLFDALGEIVIAQSIIAGDPVLQATHRNIDRKELLALKQKIQASQTILNQVQRVTLSLRMVSIKPLFVKMARLTRDVSQKTGKLVDFAKEGDETEIDKSFVEKLGDPLVHMIRNSVDHGIEMPEARKLAGKPERGTITLRAYHRSGRLYLELEDDGKGLDPDVILRKAVEKGLVREGARLERDEINRLILEPGFSTAQQVTDLSGRGVGMDVVKQAIEGLGGTLGIHSEKGKGTRFTLSLPLTLAIVNGMLVQAGSQTVILPTLSIVECANPKPGQAQEVGDGGWVFELRGEWLRLIRLTSALHLDGEETPFENGIAVIVENGLGQRVALFVDALLGGQQVVVKPLGDAIEVPDGVQGGAVGSDGKVRLILDPALLVAKAGHKSLKQETVAR